MKILGVVGSNRKNGNSFSLLNETFKDFQSAETKIIQVAELTIKPCELCYDVCSAKPFECVIKDDFQALFNEMQSADGLIITCPFYFYIPSKFQPFLERLMCLDYFTHENHGKGLSPLAGKPCGLIAVSASGSSFNAFQLLHHLQELVLTLGMRPVITNTWPYIGLSAKSGETEEGAVLKEGKVIEQAKELLELLVRELRK